MGNSQAGSLLAKLAKNVTARDTVSEVHLQEELDQIVLFHHLGLDKSVFANREKIMQENIEEYEPQLIQIYSRFERFSYFNSLFGTDQIQTVFVAFLGYQLLEKDPDWLANILRKKFPELSLEKQVKRAGTGNFIRIEEYVKKIDYPSELVNAVFMTLLKQMSEREDSIISKKVIAYAGSNTEEISGYEIVKLYTENPETFLTDEDNERIQLMFNAAYPEFVKNKRVEI